MTVLGLKVFKVIQQKAASPTCQPSRFRMDTPDLEPV